MPSPRPTASSASMPGTEEPSQPLACGAVKAGSLTPLPTPPRCGSACAPADIMIVREGSGTGEGRASTPGQAHELALKGAETDATKRALATFGNSFGLALYDREQAGVRKARTHLRVFGASGPLGAALNQLARSIKLRHQASFAGALRKAMSEADDIELLFDVWEQNVETLRVLHRSSNESSRHRSQHGQSLTCLRRRSGQAHQRNGGPDPALSNGVGARQKIDKSVLTISEPKRLRSKEHLRYVAQQPCLICGRSPSHAHHVRYAQSRGLALKVSDEFTVPLCAIHHSENHSTGDERSWWQKQNIEPLAIARGLWEESCRRGEHSDTDQGRRPPYRPQAARC